MGVGEMKKRFQSQSEDATMKTRDAVKYGRVSSKEQEKEGFSIPAQGKLLDQYSKSQGFRVVREFVDVETAKKPGRTGFDEMIKFLKRSSSVRVLLVEKTDRLYRNLKDYVTMDELDLEIHFVKESVVLSKESRSSEKFMHGIKVLMAKNYIDNLSEETRKGMLEKAEQSIYPSFAPLGYRNVMGPNGKRIIEPDPDIAPIIIQMFGWYATESVPCRRASRTPPPNGSVRGGTRRTTPWQRRSGRRRTPRAGRDASADDGQDCLLQLTCLLQHRVRATGQGPQRHHGAGRLDVPGRVHPQARGGVEHRGSFWPRNRTRMGSGAAITRLKTCCWASVEALIAERRAAKSTDRAWRSPPLRGVPNRGRPSPRVQLGSHRADLTSRRCGVRPASGGPAR